MRRFQPLIKRLRLRNRLTQRGFAALLGVPLSTYKNWEYARCHPSFPNLSRLENILSDRSREIEAAYLADKLD